MNGFWGSMNQKKYDVVISWAIWELSFFIKKNLYVRILLMMFAILNPGLWDICIWKMLCWFSNKLCVKKRSFHIASCEHRLVQQFQCMPCVLYTTGIICLLFDLIKKKNKLVSCCYNKLCCILLLFTLF